MRRVRRLFEEIKEYAESDIYPFHMPGHKRQAVSGLPREWFQSDITEVADFDDLHQPSGVLKDLQLEAAELFGANDTYLLINGSTCGILSAVASSVTRGGKLLMARNCHKSVYHAAMLREVDVSYLYPGMEAGLMISGAVLPEEVEAIMAKDTDIEAVLITSPTYEGIVSDIGAIAKVVHEYNKILIVDEAHGAHFGFHKEFPDSAVHQGADLVIHSLHKTLPAMTQTALLHVNGDRVNRERIRMYLSVFQSSSPSYLLLSSIEGCLEFLSKSGEKELDKLLRLRRSFEDKIKTTTVLYSFGREINPDLRMKVLDPGKIVIATGNSMLTGKKIAHHWRQEFQLEMEMSGPDYLLAITTVMDREEGFRRLASAVWKTEEDLRAGQFLHDEKEKEGLKKLKSMQDKIRVKALMSMAQAVDRESERIPLSASEERISAGFVALYPPGSPILVPGEEITREIITLIHSALDAGYHIQGIGNDRYINAICKKGEKIYEKNQNHLYNRACK